MLDTKPRKTARRYPAGYQRIRKLSREQRTEAVSRYLAGESSTRIGTDFGVSGAAILQHVRAAGHENRHTSRRTRLFEAAFSTVTPDSAYWVGFIMADGCVTNGNELVVALAWRDRQHLRRLRSFLRSAHSIGLYFHNSRPALKATVRFAVRSAQICADLRSFGVVPRKTKVAAVLRLEMNRDFWRGMVDGDGSLGVYRDKRYRETHGSPVISLCGTQEILGQFQKFTATIVPECRASVRQHSDNLWVWSTSSRNAARIASHLYDGAITYLPRKATLAEEFRRWL